MDEKQGSAFYFEKWQSRIEGGRNYLAAQFPSSDVTIFLVLLSEE